MTQNKDEGARCQLCGESMPEGEQMFNYHGYSGPCPKHTAEPAPSGEQPGPGVPLSISIDGGNRAVSPNSLLHVKTAGQPSWMDDNILICGKHSVTFTKHENECFVCSNRMPASAPKLLAQRFHSAYERLAPSFGYTTRAETNVPWEQLPENNRRLMIAVCEELAKASQLAPLREQLAAAQVYKRRDATYIAELGEKLARFQTTIIDLEKQLHKSNGREITKEVEIVRLREQLAIFKARKIQIGPQQVDAPCSIVVAQEVGALRERIGKLRTDLSYFAPGNWDELKTKFDEMQKAWDAVLAEAREALS